ncbi:unnamed protein product, partial [Amoebophrya sp. A25]
VGHIGEVGHIEEVGHSEGLGLSATMREERTGGLGWYGFGDGLWTGVVPSVVGEGFPFCLSECL